MNVFTEIRSRMDTSTRAERLIELLNERCGLEGCKVIQGKDVIWISVKLPWYVNNSYAPVLRIEIQDTEMGPTLRTRMTMFLLPKIWMGIWFGMLAIIEVIICVGFLHSLLKGDVHSLPGHLLGIVWVLGMALLARLFLWIGHNFPRSHKQRLERIAQACKEIDPSREMPTIY